MDVNTLIGRKVTHKAFGDGIIVDIDNVYVSVDINGNIKKFQIEALEQYFSFDDEGTRELVQKVLDEIKAAKSADEAANRAAEKARQEEADRLARQEAEILAQEKREKKETRNQPIHPYIDERRISGKHAIFLVCQNNNFQVESDAGFMWAPTHVNKGEREVASHAEMDLVKKGDIIFHHFANHIYAISVARTDCTLQAAVAGHPNAGEVGRYVELSYHFLATPSDTSGLREEKAKYGSVRYGPFTRDGYNKQGFYLSELHEKLATIFIDIAIADNPADATLVTLKSHI